MNKSELIEQVAGTAGLDKKQAEAAVVAFVDSVMTTTKSGQPVSIFGFGTFKPTARAARMGRNPQTGAAVKIAASKSVKFAPATAFKGALNTKKAAAKKATTKTAATKTAAVKTTGTKTAAVKTAAVKTTAAKAPAKTAAIKAPAKKATAGKAAVPAKKAAATVKGSPVAKKAAAPATRASGSTKKR